tara:strand:- start:3371 stop:3718 length:348 start_codon:yes stop_codon:yes gene_type:complete
VDAWAEPDELRCPLTLSLFEDPVVASDGNTYERAALKQLFATSQGEVKSPLTRTVLNPKIVVPNNALRKRMRTHLETTVGVAEAAAKHPRTLVTTPHDDVEGSDDEWEVMDATDW